MQSVCKYVYANTQKIYWCTEETIGNAKNYFKSEEGGTTKKKKKSPWLPDRDCVCLPNTEHFPYHTSNWISL